MAAPRTIGPINVSGRAKLWTKLWQGRAVADMRGCVRLEMHLIGAPAHFERVGADNWHGGPAEWAECSLGRSGGHASAGFLAAALACAHCCCPRPCQGKQWVDFRPLLVLSLSVILRTDCASRCSLCFVVHFNILSELYVSQHLCTCSCMRAQWRLDL